MDFVKSNFLNFFLMGWTLGVPKVEVYCVFSVFFNVFVEFVLPDDIFNLSFGVFLNTEKLRNISDLTPAQINRTENHMYWYQTSWYEKFGASVCSTVYHLCFDYDDEEKNLAPLYH